MTNIVEVFRWSTKYSRLEPHQVVNLTKNGKANNSGAEMLPVEGNYRIYESVEMQESAAYWQWAMGQCPLASPSASMILGRRAQGSG